MRLWPISKVLQCVLKIQTPLPWSSSTLRLDPLEVFLYFGHTVMYSVLENFNIEGSFYSPQGSFLILFVCGPWSTFITFFFHVLNRPVYFVLYGLTFQSIFFHSVLVFHTSMNGKFYIDESEFVTIYIIIYSIRPTAISNYNMIYGFTRIHYLKVSNIHGYGNITCNT